MASVDLEDLCLHINNKISTVKKILQLRNIGQDPSLETVLSKIAHESQGLYLLLNKLEWEVQRQETLKNSLKELEISIKDDFTAATHLKENIPLHLPKKTKSGATELKVQSEVAIKSDESLPKKPAKEKKLIKEMALLTIQEFDSIPTYMKNRLTYDQINGFIEELTKAVVGKYKILHQPPKSMSNVVRKLFYRFQEEETKDTKGQYFIVDQDIKEFTNLKIDKRFHGMLNILRHCQRLREVRGKGLVRYTIF
ncbi:SKA complex subunit 1 isoform X1 [Ambystoma mexicanum]|uniref:SKA complex subunit 1 isoform X1 n=1 Tax=Ambystoma mexicanum TaxID=8296 RepID=UPI0037E71733